MAFLTLAGIDLRCIDTSWGEDPPELIGEEVVMLDGIVGSTERSGRRPFSGDVIFTSKADFYTLRNAISVTGDPGVPIAVTATSSADGLLGGDSLTVYARLGRCVARRQDDPNAPSPANWKASLRFIESAPA